MVRHEENMRSHCWAEGWKEAMNPGMVVTKIDSPLESTKWNTVQLTPSCQPSKIHFGFLTSRTIIYMLF
jgi:hypothetical protein